MMERIDRTMQEDFIWAMRTRTLLIFEDDTDSWKDHKLTEGEIPNIQVKKIQNIEEEQTRLLTALLPDEVVYDCKRYQPRFHECCLLHVEIDGYDELVNACNKFSATSQITNVLNNFIGDIVSEMLQYGGDVLSITGGIILAAWRNEYRNNACIEDCGHRALDCALIIQKSHSIFETRDGYKLRMKQGVSTGTIVFSLVGNKAATTTVVFGSPILEMEELDEIGTVGDVFVTPTAWDCVNRNQYQYLKVEKNWIKVVGISRQWRSSLKEKPAEGIDESTASLQTPTDENQFNSEVRESMKHALKRSLLKDFRKFFMRPIQRALSINEGLDYLTEMRYVVVLVMRIETVALNAIDYVEVINICYQIVHSIVDYMEGSIVKVKANATDFLIEIIFGLRGFKHNLESQRGLNCAVSCFNAIQISKTIRSKQIGVTSGMTYCGSVGHKLRSEYTIIGAYVNKAYQLVQTYINKVTCDRETFLYSQMDPQYFIIQDYIPMRGVVNVGPIYQFNEAVTLVQRKYPISKFPILDRDVELDIYFKLIKSLAEFDSSDEVSAVPISALAIFGGFRQGKTRLLDEFLYCTPKSIPILPLHLKHTDKKLPYYVIQSIFSIPLGFTEDSSLEERTAAVNHKLRDVAFDKLNCALNSVFQLNIGQTDAFLHLSDEGKSIALSKLIQQLCLKCFTKVWVISIDGGEFVSDESWSLIKCMMETQRLFFVTSFSTESGFTTSAADIFLQKNTCKLELKPIEKWYQVGIACQILNVNGIPPELERVIHQLSNGNPGWIENFVISLLQANEISIESVPLEDVADYALIIPPKEMLKRTKNNEFDIVNKPMSYASLRSLPATKSSISQKRMSAMVAIMPKGFDAAAEPVEASPFSTGSDIEVRSINYSEDEVIRVTVNPALRNELLAVVDKWKLYQYSFRDSTLNIIGTIALANIGQVERRIYGGTNNPSDILVRKSSISTGKKKSIRYSVNLSHTSNAQMEMSVDICLLLPGASLNEIDCDITGNAFIMKIFDSLNSYEQLLLKCSSVIGDALPRDMVLYIMSCDDIKTNALAVKKMFEIGVLGCAQGDFIQRGANAIMNPPKMDRVESNIPICKCMGLRIPDECTSLPKYASCGYLRFKLKGFRDTIYNLLTGTQKKEFHNKAVRYLEKNTRRCRKCGEGFFTKIMGVRYDEGGTAFRRRTGKGQGGLAREESSRSVTSTATGRESIKSSHSRTSRTSRVSTVDRAASFESLSSSVGSKMSNLSNSRLRTRDSLVRSFSNLDFTDCECPRILDSMYKQMLDHCETSQQVDKWLYAVMEYSLLCIETYNSTFAIKIINNALKQIEEKYLMIVNKAGEIWKLSFLRARLLSIMGKARLELGQINDAYVVLQKALKEYGFDMPSLFKTKLMKIKSNISIPCIHLFSGNIKKDVYNAEYSDSLSDCLALLHNTFKYWKNWKHAEIAASLSLRKAMESERDFITLMTAYSNMLTICLHNRKMRLVQILEIKALISCKKYRFNVDANDLKAIFKLYANVLICRLVRGEISKSLKVGSTLMKITNSVILKNAIFDIIPLYIQALTLRNKVLEAASTILHLEYASSEDPEYDGLIWFYALCICFQLDTGYTILPFQQCEEYYTSDSSTILMNHTGAERRFHVAIWLWYLRNGKHEDAKLWADKVNQIFSCTKYMPIIDMFTSLYYLEGLILSTIDNMDRKNVYDIEDYNAKIEKVIRLLEYHSKNVKVLQPRLCLLKAFYQISRDESFDSRYLLKKGRRVAQAHSNIFDENWIDHCEQAWGQNMSAMDHNFWKEHADHDIFDYHELENNDCRLGYFTLDAPVFSL